MDGTERLLAALYKHEPTRALVNKYLGGSDAQMLHDAADRIAELEQENAMRKAECERVWALEKADNLEQLTVDLEAAEQRIAELGRERDGYTRAATMRMAGELEMSEREGGFAPPHIQIGGTELSEAVRLFWKWRAPWASCRGYDLPEDRISAGIVRVSIEFLEPEVCRSTFGTPPTTED